MGHTRRSVPVAVSAVDDRPIIKHLPTAAVAFLAAALAGAPLPFGSVEPWAETLLRLAAAAALALAAAVPNARHRLRRGALPAMALGGLALLGWLQTLPLPAAVAGLLSPRHRQVWEGAAEVLGADLSVRLSIAPAATRDTALSFLAAGAAFAAAALVAPRRRARQVLLGSLLAGTLFGLGYGLRRWLAASTVVWGVDLASFSSRLRGTFVNPNHFAVQLEIALAVVFAWGWWALRRARREGSPDRGLLLVAPPVVLWLLLFAGLALTGSRAGLLGALVAVVVQAALPAAGRRGWRRAALGLAVGAAGLAAVAAVAGWQVGFGRLLATSPGEVALGARARVAAQSLDLWLAYPLAGSGLGTFRDAFPQVQTADQWTGAWHHAHNDWLELLVTGGVLAAALLAIGLGGLVVRLARVLRGGGRSDERAAALAALGALAAVGVHELFDFGLVVPANGFALAVVCGAAAGASRSRRQPIEPRQRTGSGAQLDQVEAGRDVGGGLAATAGARPHDVDEAAVEVDLDEGGLLSLADFEDDGGSREA